MFGDELLVRVGREYVLTPFARDLVEPVNSIIAGIEQTLAHRPTFDPATEQRHFSIAMSDYAILILLDPLLQHIGEVAPGVRVHIHPLMLDSAATMLRPGGVDLVITPVPQQ